ncbi:MAG: energy transducer TonB [Ferruginibacter sp.]
MFNKMFPFLICMLFSYAVKSQQKAIPQSLPTKPIKATLISNEKIYINPDKVPEMPGGVDAWKKYLADSLDTNVPIKNRAPAGNYVVVVKSIVSYFGKISDIRAETKHGYGMEEEAKRVIKNCTRWKPAFKAGVPVNAFMRLEITFVVPAL